MLGVDNLTFIYHIRKSGEELRYHIRKLRRFITILGNQEELYYNSRKSGEELIYHIRILRQ